MDELIGAQTAQSRFIMWLMGAFAAIALSLAVIGIYGVMSYLVAQRTREIGVRLALGAAGSDILRLVVGNGARLIAVGIVIGIAATFALERLVSTLLFGVTALDAAAAIAVARAGCGRTSGVLRAGAPRDAGQPDYGAEVRIGRVRLQRWRQTIPRPPIAGAGVLLPSFSRSSPRSWRRTSPSSSCAACRSHCSRSRSSSFSRRWPASRFIGGK
jgi:hypothetical protein